MDKCQEAIEALMGMVEQHFIPYAGLLHYGFESSNEYAIDVLLRLGYAEKIDFVTGNMKIRVLDWYPEYQIVGEDVTYCDYLIEVDDETGQRWTKSQQDYQQVQEEMSAAINKIDK